MIKLMNPKKPLQVKVASKVIFNPKGNSLFCMGETNCIRIWAKKLVENSYFELLVFCIIALNSVILMLEEPALKDPFTIDTINRLNKGINFIYIVEASLKIIAMGFVLEKNSYLRDPFNVFDFVIIIVSVISMILEDLVQNT
jgi:hypothetical protein